MIKKWRWINIVTILSLIILSACQSNAPSTKTNNEVNENEQNVNKMETMTVYTSFYPLYDFATKIGGEHINVINLLPAGAEPHDYEPTARDIINLNQASAFFYNGGEFEGWIEKMVNALENEQLVVVNTSSNIQLLTNEETGNEDEHEGHEEEEYREEGHDEDHVQEANGEIDPHIWLDPLLAKQQAEMIRDTFVQLDPENQDVYEQNFSVLVAEFDRLDAEFKEMANNAIRDEFIVSHSAFGYLAHRYGLQQIPIAGLSPTNEPSQRRLQEIISFAREKEINYIMFETLVTPKVAEVVREQIGAEALILHNLEGLTNDEISNGKDYFSVMRDNLESLTVALND